MTDDECESCQKSKHYKSLSDVPRMSEADKRRTIEGVNRRLERNLKLPNKGFDLEEIEGMTKEELKEYGINKAEAVRYLKKEKNDRA